MRALDKSVMATLPETGFLQDRLADALRETDMLRRMIRLARRRDAFVEAEELQQRCDEE
jgi:hypothetical protein